MSKRPVKTVLLVEDDPAIANQLREMFRHQGSYAFDLMYARSLGETEAYLATHSVDVVLLDLGIEDAPGLEGVLRIHAASPRVSIVLLSNLEKEAAAVLAMEGGAQDYLIKGQIEAHELMRALRNAVARKAIEESFFKETERARVTLDCIGDAVICTDLTGNISFMNPVAEIMTGWSLKEAVDRPLTETFHIVDAATGLRAADPMIRAIGQDRPTKLPVNCILMRRGGKEVFIEESVAPIHDRQGMAAGSVLVFRDVTVSRALAAQITHLAEHDSLTGLPNRLLLNDRLGQAIALADRTRSMLAVLFLDLDGFRHINDSLGHPTGDRLLESVAKQLLTCVRSSDTISRQGGDEFIVLLQNMQQPEDAAIGARRILQAVAEIHLVEKRELHITASIGISVYPEDGLNAEALIKNADTAMYQAKESGRQTFMFFKREMNVRAVERQSIEEDLRRALERDEFTLHYQPKIDLKSGTITGAEALLRWTNPRRGSVPPARFISVAEDSGLILPIGAWVMRGACAQARCWQSAGLPALTIAVNISTIQFRDESFVAGLLEILEETGLDPRCLELELTESILMERTELTAPILQTLREKGIRVSVDDFGTGYSSLSYLRKLPLDALKIDQSFVSQLATAPEDTAIVSAIISMGRSLNLRVIAEGVETADELAFLRAHGCDEAQGYYFSHPVPAAEFVELLKRDGGFLKQPGSAGFNADGAARRCS